MRVPFLLQNAPGQFRHLVPHLDDDLANEVMFFGERSRAMPRRVRGLHFCRPVHRYHTGQRAGQRRLSLHQPAPAAVIEPGNAAAGDRTGRLDRHRQLVEPRSRWRMMEAACWWLRRSGAGDLGPNLKGLDPDGSIRGGWNVVSAEQEEGVDPVMSVIMTRGGRHCSLSSLRNRRLAACVSRRLCTRMSSTPVRRSREAVWSAARHSPC